jgi:hypothetical protein
MEYPEVQMITFNVPEKVAQTGRLSSESVNQDSDKPPISVAKRRFVEAVFKIIAELATKRDQAIREHEKMAMENMMRQLKKGSTPTLPPLFEAPQGTNKWHQAAKRGKYAAHAQQKSLLVPVNKHGGSSGERTPRKTPRVRLPDILPEVDKKGPASVYVSKPGGFGMHLSSLVRLARFRKMMSRRENGSHHSEESEAEEEGEEELPTQPRFCATLSPEAQYAMMKGM